MILLVTYDLKGTRDYSEFFAAIQQQSAWWHYLSSTWLIDIHEHGDLRKLGALTGKKLRTRKPNLAQVIIRHLVGERLRTLWQRLINRAAIAEVVHSSSTPVSGA
jgi:hypothetical protein